jgi:pimeloyl-ACP methyl ester carboxylesterase
VSRAIPLHLWHDFGGRGRLLHLAHANGFPPGTYRPLAEALIQDYRVAGMPARPLWPGSRPADTPSWHPLADDLVQTLDALALKEIIGMGHSMGGVSTLLAAIHRPDLFRVLILMDPVILPPLALWGLRLMRWLGLDQRQPLVQGALRRRRTWPSRQACFDHYRAKSFFARWPDASLRAYVESGTRPLPDGQVTLTYPVEWEAHIFATTPTDIWRYVPRLGTPVLVIRGDQSNAFRPESQRQMARLVPHAHFATLPEAGHLFPMERPTETATMVLDFLKERGD